MTLEKRECPECGKESTMFIDDKKCWDCQRNDKMRELSKRVKDEGFLQNYI